MCKSRLFWWQTQKKCVKQSFKSFTNLSSWVYFGHIYSCVYVCACVYECIGVYLCVFVCICVNICICVGTLEGSVWGCGQSDDSSKERTVELLTSDSWPVCAPHFKSWPFCHCLLQKYINFALLTSKFITGQLLTIHTRAMFLT